MRLNQVILHTQKTFPQLSLTQLVNNAKIWIEDYRMDLVCGKHGDALNSHGKCTKCVWAAAKRRSYVLESGVTYFKGVTQMDLNGELIEAWDGIKFAAEALKINQANIVKVCRGKAVSAGGFKWKYLEIF